MLLISQFNYVSLVPIVDSNLILRQALSNKSRKIEEYHRGIKQFCGVEKFPVTEKESKRAHVMFS